MGTCNSEASGQEAIYGLGEGGGMAGGRFTPQDQIFGQIFGQVFGQVFNQVWGKV